MSPKLDILIPAINNSYFTCSLINSIKKNTEIDYRIIYIDNGSQSTEFNNVSDALAGSQFIIIRNKENLGFSQAINQGLKLSDAEYICLQNNDTLIFKGCFERLIAHLEKNPQAGLITPIASRGGGRQGIEILQDRLPLLNQVTKDLDLNRITHQKISEYLYNRLEGRTAIVNGTIAFYSVLMPRTTFNEVGFLDENYGVGFYEDNDYCQRIIAQDLQILIALDVYVWHYTSATFKSVYLKEEIDLMLNINREIFYKNWNKWD